MLWLRSRLIYFQQQFKHNYQSFFSKIDSKVTQKGQLRSIIRALLILSIISTISSNICMSQNEVPNSPLVFRAQKNHFLIEISLHKHQKNPLIQIAIRNNTTNIMFNLEMDTIEITRDKVLSHIFRHPQELYEELVSGFEQIIIEENPKYLLIKHEIKVGKFRTEPITLHLKPLSKSNKQKEKLNISPFPAKRKIFIDKSYARDFNLFKESFNKICEKIAHKEVLGRLNVKNDRNSRLKIKNMFIVFSNSILKAFRKNVEFADIEITQEECFTQPANKLLAQKNELLQNILLKAMKRIKETPTQPIEIDFMPQIPTQLLVVTANNQQVPLQRYLIQLPKQQIQTRIRYHQKRRERISNSLNLINQLKKQRGEQMSRILERSESERRSSLLSFGNRVNLSDTNDYDEF